MSKLKNNNLSIRPIRALERGLVILKELNQFNGASVTDISKRVGLPRTTSYRILETLCLSGYSIRDKTDDLYRLTAQVRSLSDGFDDESWIKEIAKPMLDELGKELIWPLAISTLSGESMLVRETTDKTSPLALERYTPGVRVSILNSSSGRVYLSFCKDNEREAILNMLKNSKGNSNVAFENNQYLQKDIKLIYKLITKIKKDGYSSFDNPSNPEMSVAVPLFSNNKLIAAIVIRFIKSALPLDQAVNKYVPLLKKASKNLERKLLEKMKND